MIPVHHADKFISKLAILKKRYFWRIINSMTEEDKEAIFRELKKQLLGSKTNSMILGFDLQKQQTEELFKKTPKLTAQASSIFDDKATEKQKQPENRTKTAKLEQEKNSRLQYRLRQERELVFGPENDVMRVSTSYPVRRHHLSPVQQPRLLQQPGRPKLQRTQKLAYQVAWLPLRRRPLQLQTLLHPQAHDC